MYKVINIKKHYRWLNQNTIKPLFEAYIINHTQLLHLIYRDLITDAPLHGQSPVTFGMHDLVLVTFVHVHLFLPENDTHNSIYQS